MKVKNQADIVLDKLKAGSLRYVGLAGLIALLFGFSAAPSRSPAKISCDLLSLFPKGDEFGSPTLTQKTSGNNQGHPFSRVGCDYRFAGMSIEEYEGAAAAKAVVAAEISLGPLVPGQTRFGDMGEEGRPQLADGKLQNVYYFAFCRGAYVVHIVASLPNVGKARLLAAKTDQVLSGPFQTGLDWVAVDFTHTVISRGDIVGVITMVALHACGNPSGEDIDLVLSITGPSAVPAGHVPWKHYPLGGQVADTGIFSPIDTSSLADGRYDVVLKGKDRYGHEQQASTYFVLEGASPFTVVPGPKVIPVPKVPPAKKSPPPPPPPPPPQKATPPAGVVFQGSKAIYVLNLNIEFRADGTGFVRDGDASDALNLFASKITIVPVSGPGANLKTAGNADFEFTTTLNKIPVTVYGEFVVSQSDHTLKSLTSADTTIWAKLRATNMNTGQPFINPLTNLAYTVVELTKK